MGEKPAAKSRLAFSKTRLHALSRPAKGRVYHYDEKTAGLCLCVTAAGTKTFYCYRWANGRPIRIRIGKFPEVTVERARKQAAALNGAIAKGEDPQALRIAARHEPTLGMLHQHWMESYAKLHKKSWREDERQYNQFLKPWRNRRLSAIQKREVQALHTRIGELNGHYAANRLLALVRAMFNKAGDIGYDGRNPAVGVKKFKEQARDRFLQPEEVPRFFEALQHEPNAVLRDLILMMLLTGARRANVEAMAWEDVNVNTGVWRIPDTKIGEPMLVHLCPTALEILQRRQANRDGSAWVFPTASRTGHVVDPKFAWKRLVKRAGLSDLRLHDLRRTLGSWQAATGASLCVIGKTLGHKRASTTQVYARLNLDPVRQSVDKATRAILGAAGVSETTDQITEER